MNVLEKFLRYVQIDTTSQDDCDDIPSTQKQFNLAKILAKELADMGASDVKLDSHCYVYATIPANNGKKGQALGFVAHMDTAPVLRGDAKPIVHKNYDGKDLVLPSGDVISPEEFCSLKNYIGQDIVTADGTTLLGSDDKAGVAEIVAMAEYFLKNPDIKHGEIKIGFTPDEEVGKGADMFDVKGFGADFAFTVDGEALGEIEYENFNAAAAFVEFFGKSIHPGSAKGKMINAAEIACEFCNNLPATQKPQYTEGYEGFFHLTEMSGDVNFAKSHYILRDHDSEQLQQKIDVVRNIALNLNKKYGDGTVKLTIKHSYKNMAEKILPHMDKLDLVKEAFAQNGVTSKTVAIRGGTDGARLSFMGLPCPNLCTGGHNVHSKKEYVSVQSLNKVAECLVTIAILFGQRY